MLRAYAFKRKWKNGIESHGTGLFDKSVHLHLMLMRVLWLFLQHINNCTDLSGGELKWEFYCDGWKRVGENMIKLKCLLFW